MAKTIFEQTGGTYTMQGDYYLPNLTLPPEEERPIGVWAHRRREYLKQHRKSCTTICSLPASSAPISLMWRKKHSYSFFGW